MLFLWGAIPGIVIGATYCLLPFQSGWIQRTFPVFSNFQYKSLGFLLVGSVVLTACGLLVVLAPVFKPFLQTRASVVLIHSQEYFVEAIYVMLGLVIFSYKLPLRIRPALAPLEYERFGRLHNWGAMTAKFLLDRGWKDRIEEAADQLAKQIPATESERLNILSPAAGAAEYELIIGDQLALSKEVTIYASDVSHVNPAFDYEHKQFRMVYAPGIDAWKLDGRYEAETFHGMLDFKGFIWHFYSKAKRREGFKLLHHLLKPGAIILIDAHPTKPIRYAFNNVVMANLFGWIFWPAEPSTYAMLKKAFKQDPELQQYFRLDAPSEKGALALTTLRRT